MKEIDSGALELLNRMLRLGGGNSSEGPALLEEDRVSSVLDLQAVIRRSLALPGTGGIGIGVLQAVNGAGATIVSVTLDPYAAGDDAIAPFPITIPPHLDFYVIGAGLSLVAVTATNFVEGLLSLNWSTAEMGFGRDQAGASVAATTGLVPLARWDLLSTVVQPASIGVKEDGNVYQAINMRIRRGMTLRYDQAATNAVEVNCVVVYALLPLGLGQDVAS